ncbi:MAG: hypothetical protein Q8N47_24475 [Bryobacterales bacterium]|nr:hypothetical protein [Bryobacterales bacterium]
MKTRALLALLALAAGAAGAEKAPPSGKASGERIEIEAVVYADKAAVRELIGEELDGIAVVQLRVVPRGDEALAVGPDDFLLRSDRDGQRSEPFAPSQIAGNAALVVASGSSGRGGMVGQENGPIWGGAPGTGGRPRRMGGDGAAVGNVSDEKVQTSMNSGDKDKESPLLAKLKQKMLPAKRGTEPVSGLLYFSLEGKHKPKDLELVYRGPAGKLSIRFK